MDLKAYYRRIREVESSIGSPFVFVVGVETPDGGKPGTFAEVSKCVAAKLIAENRARLASEIESREFEESRADARREAEALAATQRMQVTIVPTADYRTRPARPARD